MKAIIPLLRGFALFAMLVVTVACSRSARVDSSGVDTPALADDETNLLFWHTWSADYAPVLQGMVDLFETLNPNVQVVLQRIEPEEFQRQMESAHDRGFGPDLVLVDSMALPELADAGIIEPLGPGIDIKDIWPVVMPAVTRGAVQYGLPFAGYTQVLFYDKRHVDSAPQTIEELTAVTTRGAKLAIPISFESSMWGIKAYGGRLFDDEGQLALEEGGFANWLDYLRGRKAIPGITVGGDLDELRAAFAETDVAYYVGAAIERAQLLAMMGDAVGVQRLPAGPAGSPPGPLMHVDALALGGNLRGAEHDAAQRLMQFLVNPAQQNLLVTKGSDRIPANSLVRILPSMPEDVREHARQMRSAIPVPMDQVQLWKELSREGDRLYDEVLNGVSEPRRAIAMLVNQMGSSGVVEAARPGASRVKCPVVSEETLAKPLVIYHGWTQDIEKALRSVADTYQTLCPGVKIETIMVPDNQFLNQKYTSEVTAGAGSDILIDSTEWMAILADDGLIRNMNGEIDPDFLQQFLPTTLQALRYKGGLYGLPESVNNSALLYDKTRTNSPPQIFEDFINSANQGLGFSMPLRYNYAFWGMRAFGGRLFTDDGNVWPDTTGLANWMKWLREASRVPNIILTNNPVVSENQMMDGETVFVVSKPSSLPRIANRFGLDKVGAALLPIGPVDISSPLLEVESVMFNPQLVGDRLDLAIAFGQYLVSPESQARLAETGMHATANVLVDLREWPILDTFREQASVATVRYENKEWIRAREQWNKVYLAIVVDGADPVSQVEAFYKQVQAAIDEVRGADAIETRESLNADVDDGESLVTSTPTPEATR